MKKITIKYLLLLLGFTAILPACFDDLNTVPLDTNESTAAAVYDSAATYRQVLAKLYAGLAVTGQEGPAGKPDISGVDEGFGSYLRMYWYPQELATDEAVIGWNDATIKDFHYQRWDANDGFIAAMYGRIYFQIALVNEFIRETTDAKLDSRGVTDDLRNEIVVYRAEARFLRALSYWHALDLFRNVPFVTEADGVGKYFPPQKDKAFIFAYIESELKAIESILLPPQSNEYARADQAAAWTLLAKLYLNAETYLGTPRYSDCITYCDKVINAGYTLAPVYADMFKADNHLSPELIFPVAFDGLRTQTYGGTTFLVHAPIGGTMVALDYGVAAPWSGIRTTSAIVSKFPAVGSGSVIIPSNPGNTTYPVLYVPGSYQSPAWDVTNTSTVLASATEVGKYEGYLNFADADSQFKFADGPSWDINYGDTGADGVLDQGGDNIVAPEAGFYKIEVDLNNLSYTLLKTQWGLIGSATPDGWNSDQDMAYDAATNTWTIVVNLIAGAIKFRANDNWDLNYGDSGADGLLERGGADIAIASAGKYKVTLFLDKPDHTFSVELATFDNRALFYTEGQSIDINDISDFTNGYAVGKWSNVNSDGSPASHNEFVDTDFPMFRLSDVYLMYAEAVVRGGGGSMASAIDYVNQIRNRAYDGDSGNVSEGDLSLDFLLDERCRELFWEGHRRTDLVRFGKFSNTDYVWQWKGGVKDGISTDSRFDILPIPASDLGANPTLMQNDGY